MDRYPHTLTRIPQMTTPQTFENPETKTSPYVTETRQTSKGCYVLPFTGIRNQPMKASAATNRESGTVTVDKGVHQGIRKKVSIEKTGEKSRQSVISSGSERIETERNAGTSRTEWRCTTSRSVCKASPRCFRCDILCETKREERYPCRRKCSTLTLSSNTFYNTVIL